MTSVASNLANFDIDDLPDGACISPKRIFPECFKDGTCLYENVKYVGSVLVSGDDAKARAHFVQQQLTTEWDVNHAAGVSITISLNGIQVRFDETKKLCMSHPLSRVSFSTCDTTKRLFSFVACEKSDVFRQYCHLFVTSQPQHASELNEIVDSAFRMPFTFGEPRSRLSLLASETDMEQLSKRLTFHELIEQQVAQQHAENQENDARRKQLLQQKLESISTTRVTERTRERNERRKVEEEKLRLEKEKEVLEGKERASWAKYVVPRVRHRSPHIEPGGGRCVSPGALALRSSEIGGRASRSSQQMDVMMWPHNQHHHGSPVVALKEHIDNQFSAAQSSVSLSQINLSSAGGHH